MKMNPIGMAASLFLGLAGLPFAAHSQAQVSGGVLRVLAGPAHQQAKFIVGPAVGVVEVHGVPGLPDGARLTGVTAIDWIGGAGDDQLTFEVQQDRDFDLNVATGSGQSQVDVKYTIPASAVGLVRPTVALNLGAGLKKVQVQLESFAPRADFMVNGIFGAGDTEFRGELQYKQGSQSAKGRMDLQFGAGLNKAELSVDSEAQHLDLDLRPRFMQELSTKVISDDPSSSARVRFAPVGTASGSKIGFEMISAAPTVQLDHDVSGGAGMDEVKLNLTTLRASTITSNASLRLGEAMDKMELAYTALPGSTLRLGGLIDLGGGDDEANLLVDPGSVVTLQLNCGAGTDKAIGFPRTVNCELN